MKKCNTCKEFKSLESFGKRSASKDGLALKCRGCQKAYDKARANLPHRVKARLDYSKTEHGKASGSRAKKAWLERNTVKRAAHIMVGNAIRDGKLEKRLDCSECDDKECVIHGHHDDYAKPLEVRWLCSLCHNKWHKENGPGLNSY